MAFVPSRLHIRAHSSLLFIYKQFNAPSAVKDSHKAKYNFGLVGSWLVEQKTVQMTGRREETHKMGTGCHLRYLMQWWDYILKYDKRGGEKETNNGLGLVGRARWQSDNNGMPRFHVAYPKGLSFDTKALVNYASWKSDIYGTQMGWKP